MNRRQFARSAMAAGIAPVLLGQQASSSSNRRLRAGFSEQDITPQIGMEQPGGYTKAFHRKFHDPCKVRAAVFDNGERKAALVGIDALVIPRQVVMRARQSIHEYCGITPEAVMIGASHSHSAGPIGMVLPGEYDGASPLVQKLAYQYSSCADPAYLKQVESQIVHAVTDANSKSTHVRCSFGVGHEDRVAFNRRFRMRNGQTWTHPGQGNPDIIRPAGPIDPAVGVVVAWDDDDKMLGCIVNYACHGTTSPGAISADWIYYLEKTIQGAVGSTPPVVFLQGCCGDITQVDNQSPYQRPSGEEWAKLVGGRIGSEAMKAMLLSVPGEVEAIDFQSKLLSIPRRLPSPEHLKTSFAILQSNGGNTSSTEWVFAKEIVMLDALAARSKQVDAEVQAIQLGPAVFIATPGEMFCDYGLELRSHSRFPITFPVELANGSVGYVPTEEALSPSGGGYETRLTSYTNLEPTAGTQMVKAGLQLASHMRPGSIPKRAEVDSFHADPNGIGTHPWSYGDVPPQLS